MSELSETQLQFEIFPDEDLIPLAKECGLPCKPWDRTAIIQKLINLGIPPPRST